MYKYVELIKKKKAEVIAISHILIGVTTNRRDTVVIGRKLSITAYILVFRGHTHIKIEHNTQNFNNTTLFLITY